VKRGHGRQHLPTHKRSQTPLKRPDPATSNVRNRGWLDKALKGTTQHFSCFLPARLGRISTAILKLFYSGISFGKDQTAVIERLPKDAIVVYVNKHKSKFEFLFYHTYCVQNRLPVPEIGFDYHSLLWQPLSRLLRILAAQLAFLARNMRLQNPYHSGYIENELLCGRTGFLSLVEKGAFYGRFVKAKADPVRYLLDLQKRCDRPIFLVPLLMFFNRNPLHTNPSLLEIFFGQEGKPGRIRRLITLFRNPGKVFVEVSEPLNLQEFLAQTGAGIFEALDEYPSLVVRRNLLKQLNRHRQAITGPVLKSFEELKETVLTGERFRDFLTKHAESRSVSLSELRKEADGYLEEIAAKYNANFIKISAMAVGKIIDTMFDGVSINSEAIQFVKNASQKAPLILIPCHKSHIDYLILSYILYNHNMPCPHIAAGKNLSFWPLGPIFRRGGAFFIRRTFRGAVLYSKVFTEYLHKLLEEGFNIEFFIEGTRSRTGKLILPKLGFLSMILEAFKNGASDDMIFVPIYIGYDQVLEESAYIHEIKGGQKEPENLLQVLKARKFLKKRYGKIYIRVQDPLSLNDLLQNQDLNIATMTAKEKNTFCRNLGFRVINAINKATVVTAHGLVAGAILNQPKTLFTREELKSVVEVYLRHLTAQGSPLADTLHIDPEHAVENALEAYIQRKFIEPVSKGKDEVGADIEYTVNDNARSGLEYYKNNCISYFIPAAYTAMEVLHLDAFQFASADLHAGYRTLQHLFKNEFAYDVDLPAEHFVRKTLKSFIDDAIIIPHQTLPDTYNVTSTGFRKLNLFAAFLKTYLESYLIVLNHFMWAPKDALSPKDRLKKIEARGRRMYKRKEIQRREALSKVTYENAIDFFTGQGIKGSEDIEKTEAFAVIVNRYLSRF
jgi:glycerol-3-phosphate O-acyltransferase